MLFARGQLWRSCAGFCFMRPATFLCSASLPLQRNGKCWQVSSLGRVCSTHGVISEGMLDGCGYRRVKIAAQIWLVHRIVMLMFHGPPSWDQWQVHHKDGDKTNNRLENLEYVTPRQNVIYSFAASNRLDTWHIQSKPVLWRTLGSQTWERCLSVKAAGKEFGLSESAVSKCCHNNSQVKGIEFRFQELQEPSMEGETWLPMCNTVTGAEVPGRFVSSQGRITSPHGHISQGSLHVSGYYRTQVLGRTERVHRLVASAFLGPASSSKVYVNHKDLNKQNNAVDNLEYVTAAENVAHYHANSCVNRSGGRKPVWSRLCGSDEDWKWHSSMAAAAKVLGVHVGNIWHCLHGNRKQTGGYEFRLASPATKSLPGEGWRAVCLSTLMQDKAILRKAFD